MATNVFDEMGVYWAEIADQNQTEKQLQFLKKQINPDGYILDVACGTGRHSIPLSQLGYSMVGVDVSANLLKIAKLHSKETQLVRGDMRFLPFKTQAFTAAISMDTSFGYLKTEQDDMVSLTEVQRVITQGGIFIIDVFNRQELTLKYKNPSCKSKEYPSFFLQQKRSVSSDSQWLCDLWIIQDKKSERITVFEHTARLYKRGKLENMLEKAGFGVKEVFGGYEKEKFNFESPRLIFVEVAK